MKQILPRFLTTATAFLLFMQVNMTAQTKELIAYFPEWGVTHQPYYVKHMETNKAADKITVLLYAFCEPGPDSSGNIVPKFMNPVTAYQQVYNSDMSIDGVPDDSTQPLRGHFNQLKKLKARHPQIKIVISIGGWTGSNYLSDAVLTKESRKKFVDDIIDRYITGNLPVENNAGGQGAAAGIFDGIDIDWEYPISGGNEGIHHNDKDNDNLSDLYALFREKLDAIKPGLLLTAAVPTIEKLARNYNINEDQKYLNWYNLMTYDFRGGWSAKSGHHTNLFSTAFNDSSEGMRESLDNSVKFFRDSLGLSNDKIVPGAAFYGRGWIVKDSLNNGLYKPGKSAPGIYEAGFNYYTDLLPLLDKGYNLYWDSLAMAPFLFSNQDKIFWTLDNEKSLALKARYVDAYNLRGNMLWEISGDDTNGSLINAIYSRKMSDKKTIENGTETGFRQIKITYPVSSGDFIKGSSIIIRTDAGTYSNNFVKVEFFVDGISVGYDTGKPFSWVWFNITEGKHVIKVTAIDKNNNKLDSEPVIVNVK